MRSPGVAGGEWKPATCCSTCVEYLLNTQWKLYVDLLEKTTCAAEQRRLLEKGPPLNVSVRPLLALQWGTRLSAVLTAEARRGYLTAA